MTTEAALDLYKQALDKFWASPSAYCVKSMGETYVSPREACLRAVCQHICNQYSHYSAKDAEELKRHVQYGAGHLFFQFEVAPDKDRWDYRDGVLLPRYHPSIVPKWPLEMIFSAIDECCARIRLMRAPHGYLIASNYRIMKAIENMRCLSSRELVNEVVFELENEEHQYELRLSKQGYTSFVLSRLENCNEEPVSHEQGTSS